MQIWNAREISAAILEKQPAEKPAQILQSTLACVRQNFSAAGADNVERVLCGLDEFSLSNPQGVHAVWIAGGTVVDDANDKKYFIVASGYSIAEAIVALIAEAAKFHAVAVGNSASRCHINCTAHYPGLMEYCKSLRRSDAEKAVGDDLVSLKHLANKTVTCFPRAYCRLPPSSERAEVSAGIDSMVWDGCAAQPRQRDAIASGLCEKIAHHCLARWSTGRHSPRINSVESEYLFDYYSRCCSRITNNRSEILLDLSLDWGPPVFAALSCDTDGQGLAIGVGCGSGSHRAICAAVLDLHRNEFVLFQSAHKKQSAGSKALLWTGISTALQAGGFELQTSELMRTAGGARKTQFYSDYTFVRKVAEQAEQNGVDIFYTNIEDTKIPFPVVKVVSPQLLAPIQ